MIAIALIGLEHAINTYLQLDKYTIAHLSDLQNKIIMIEIIDWNVVIYVKPHASGVHLLSEYSGKPETEMRATLLSLVKVGLAKGDGSALFENKVEISGDTVVGEKIREILQKVDIDWEEHLS